MTERLKVRTALNLILVLLLSSIFSAYPDLPKAQAATATHVLDTSTKWNVRFDGANAGDAIGLNATMTADLNGNGIADLVICAINADYNSRSNSGSIYIIYDNLLDDYTGTGNTVDLSDSSKWNIRIDGPVASTFSVSTSVVVVPADINNNQKNELLIAAQGDDNNSRTNSGSVYVLNDDLLDNYSGTGNTIDLADSTKYNLRIDGAAASDILSTFSALRTGDINNDNKNELLIGAQSDNNSRTNSGSLYILNNDLISGYSSTGNTLDLNSTWSLRIDGAAASDFAYGPGGAMVGDFNNDGLNDLVSTALSTDYTESNAGSAYFFQNSLLNISGSNQTLDLATSSSYTLRIDGPSTNASFPVGISFRDLNGNGFPEFFGGSTGGTYEGRTGVGSVYIFSDQLLRSYYSSTGNTTNIASSTGYSVRIVGSATSDQLSAGKFSISNYLGLGDDILVSANLADTNGDGSGATWLVGNNLISPLLASSGNVLDLASSSSYSLRYDGAASGVRMLSFDSGDINNDNRSDLIMASYSADYNSRTDSGSVYLIYNFPHTLSVNESRIDTSNTNPRITGSLTATNSSTTINDVQYSLTSADPNSSSWTSCTASDGSFNSTSESFTCALSFASDATHNVFIRGKDTNGAYTYGSSYRFVPLTVDRSSLSTFTLNAPQYSKDGTVIVNGTYNDDRSGLDKIITKGIGTGSVVAGLSGASWSVTYANVPDGVYRLSAIAYDRAGNESQATAGADTIVDRAAPSLTITAASSTAELGTSVSGTVADGLSGVDKLTVVNKTNNKSFVVDVKTAGTYAVDVPLTTGDNTIEATAVDKAGNSVTKTATVTKTQFTTTGTTIPLTVNSKLERVSKADVLNALKLGKGTNAKDKSIITAFQERLKTLGHFTTKVTGYFGSLTTKAVVAFQKSIGIKPTGTVDTRVAGRVDGLANTSTDYLTTLAANKAGLSVKELQDAAIYQLTKDLKASQKDEEVKFIQKKLYILGYYTGSITGTLDSATQSAIKSYRTDRGLGVGLVDAKLREKLNNL